MDNITFIVKAFEREKCVLRLLRSIRKYYPNIPTIVVDDSKIKSDKIENYLVNGEYIFTSHNIGLSAGRNLALKHVKTEYFFLLDDDVVFTSNTDVETIINEIIGKDLGICGLKFFDYGIFERKFQGVYDISDGILNRHLSESLIGLDFIVNCFVGRTDLVNKIKWDNSIKIGYEHDDFFLRVKKFSEKVNIGICSEASIHHYPYYNKEYNTKRNDVDGYKEKFFSKSGIRGIKTFGDVYGFLGRLFIPIISRINRYVHLGPL